MFLLLFLSAVYILCLSLVSDFGLLLLVITCRPALSHTALSLPVVGLGCQALGTGQRTLNSIVSVDSRELDFIVGKDYQT